MRDRAELTASFLTLLARFRDDTSGVFAIIFGVMAIVLIALGGAVVDYVRWTSDVHATQEAADASSLAAASSTAQSPYDIRAIVEGAAAANHVDPTHKIDRADFDKTTNRVQVSISGTYQTIFLQLVGVQTLPVLVSSTSERAMPGQLEVALVLDNTWSMSDRDATGVQKIVALKGAASTLVDALFSDPSPNVKASLVPYADYVNVGVNNRNEPWIKVPANYQTSTPKTCQTMTTKQQCTRTQQKTCTRVVDGVPESYDCSTYSCTTVNVAPYQQCSGGYTTDYRWYGCVLSRTQSDLRLRDEQPGVPYVGFLSTSQSCLNPIVPLSTDKNALKASINAMIVNVGGYKPQTYIPTAVLWGINTLSSTPPFTEGADYDPANEHPHKALVLMTDGENTLQFQSSDGRHVGFSSNVTTAATQKTKADGETNTLCTYAKARNIEVFTVSFGTLTAAANKLLSDCATSPDNYFAAQNAAQLQQAFESIARSLKQVRLVR